MTEVYQHTFTPWTVDGDARVLADEKQWREPVEWNVESALGGYYAENARVHVTPDLFEDFDGPIVDTNRFADESENLTLSDLRHRLFGLIGKTPNLDWMIETQYPENVRRMWPATKGQEDGIASPLWKDERQRNNVMLGVRITTQAEADTLIPRLLKLRDSARMLYVVVDPREAIELWDYITPKVCDCNYNGCECYPGESMIDFVILRGTADQLHPEWIWNIRDQCSAGGVQLDGQEWQEAIAGTPSNSRLRELAANNPPPDEWFEGEEDKPWTKR